MKFLLTYKMHPDKKADCYTLFSKMGHEDDLKDSGPHIQVDSRLHDMGEGSGLCIVDAYSTHDIYSWAYNWASMCDITLKPMLTDHEARLIVQGKSNPTIMLMKQFTTAMSTTLDAEKYCTEKALFNPPGAPPMPIQTMTGMMKGIKQAFPEWKSVMLGYKENDDGSAIVYTQQQLGPMKGDLAAMGPFPAVSLNEVPPRCRDNANVFPVEEGVYTFNKENTKIKCGTYEGTIMDVSTNPAVSHYGKTVDPWISEHWNQKGDQSDVGFGLLFQMMGVDLSELRAKGQV